MARSPRGISIEAQPAITRARQSFFEPCRKYPGVFAGVCLFVLVLAIFGPALKNDFVGYDDPEYVTGNLHVQQGLTWGTVKWAFSSTEVAAWHPVTWLSHALDYQIFGLRAWGHHLTSVLLHALNSVLCFFLLHRITGRTGASWAVAALFAVHPLRVESVAWVSERKDVLSMSFFFLTLLSYTRYSEAIARNARPVPQMVREHATQLFGFTLYRSPKKFFFGLSILFFALGIMSKPMLVTVPFVLILLDFWPLRRWPELSIGKLLTEKIPFLAGSILVSVVTVLAQPHGTVPEHRASLLVHFENASVAYCWYLYKLIWPVNLAPFYPPVEHRPIAVWLGACGLLMALTCLAIATWRHRPYFLVGWFWFLLTLVPVIGLVQIGEQSVTDRYSYLPSVGLFLVLVWTLGELTTSRGFLRSLMGTVLGAVLISCCILTRNQIAYWQNSDVLFRHTLAVTSRNYLAHNNLGVTLSQQGQWNEAIEQYQLALRLKPGYPEALKNLGVAFEYQRLLDKAVEAYQAALKERPDFAAAHNGLGLVYERQGRFDAAVQQFQQAIALKPDYADAHFNLALEFERQGLLDKATAELESTLQLQPNSADIHNNLGVLREKQGRVDDAIESYLKAIQLNPNSARAYFNLGVALTKKGMLNDAVAAFETALRLNPGYPAARTNLAILKSLRQSGTAP